MTDIAQLHFRKHMMVLTFKDFQLIKQLKSCLQLVLNIYIVACPEP